MPWMSDLSECGAAAGGGSHGTDSKGRFYYGRGARSTPNGQAPNPKVNAPWRLGVGSWELGVEGARYYEAPIRHGRRWPAAAARWRPPTRTRAGTPRATGWRTSP